MFIDKIKLYQLNQTLKNNKDVKFYIGKIEKVYPHLKKVIVKIGTERLEAKLETLEQLKEGELILLKYIGIKQGKAVFKIIDKLYRLFPQNITKELSMPLIKGTISIEAYINYIDNLYKTLSPHTKEREIKKLLKTLKLHKEELLNIKNSFSEIIEMYENLSTIFLGKLKIGEEEGKAAIITQKNHKKFYIELFFENLELIIKIFIFSNKLILIYIESDNKNFEKLLKERKNILTEKIKDKAIINIGPPKEEDIKNFVEISQIYEKI